MLLSFPHMHPTLSPVATVPGLRYFDPGMTDAPSEHDFRPADLPLDPKTAASLVRDSISFGEQFKDPEEMAYFGVMTPDEFYEGSATSIQSQLLTRLAEAGGQGEDRARREAMARAQFVMLLAWFFEERAIELQSLELGVKASWKAMDVTLGIDDDDRADERALSLGNAYSHTGGASDGRSVILPWQRMMEVLPALLPDDVVLVCGDPEIIAAWADADITFEPADPDLGLPEGARTARQPAWRLAGRRKPVRSMPETERELSVAIIS
jgi:hypothetical protein